MKDDARSSPMALVGLEDAEVRKLANRAISVLATNGGGHCDGLARRLRALCDAYIDLDQTARHEALLTLLQDGVATGDMIDHVIPATARLMGERWFADEISFADVSIGSARLQETVHALAERDKRDRQTPDRPAILLVIPRPEHHTLGIFVAADQLRRLGYSVDVAVDRHPRQVSEMLRNRRYHMVGITASSRRTLASARELVETIKGSVTRVTPIVIGGTALDLGTNVLKLTGADHTARSVKAALEKCGLAAVQRTAPPEERPAMPIAEVNRP